MRVKTWKVVDAGGVVEWERTVELECDCGHAAELPVNGRPIAQVGSGIVFDPGPRSMPLVIQCRKCGRVLELDTKAAA